MMTRKLLALFILASLAGHVLVLALTTRVDWGMNASPAEVLTVTLKAPDTPLPTAEKPPAAQTPPPRQNGARKNGNLREDSVTLNGRDSRYDDYLQAVRRKIEGIWHYPQQALAERKEGNVLIRFTIEANGALSGYHVVTTSGSSLLDEGTLSVVRSAAPYEPLPGKLNLSRLNITATFTYRMNP